MQKWILVDKKSNFDEFKLKNDSFYGDCYVLGYGIYGEQPCTEYHEVLRDNTESFPEIGEWHYSEERYSNGLRNILGVFSSYGEYISSINEAIDCGFDEANEIDDWQMFVQKLLGSEKYKIVCITGLWREMGLNVNY